MADLSKLKRKTTLGSPPSIDEASQNLTKPELAPSDSGAVDTKHIDGRSLRKTNRTIQFATKVSPEFNQKFRAIAARDHLEFCVLLEKSLDTYEASLKDNS